MSKNNELTVVEPKELVGPSMSAHGLAGALQEEGKKRQLLKEYIQNNLVEGVDFGKIKLREGMSKDCLFKPGAEKICSLLNLIPSFSIDKDMIPIVGAEVIPYVCHLTNRHTGAIEGEGRGSCSLKEKNGNANIAIKIAQKRAQIDAVLRVSALSGQFTQDIEEMPINEMTHSNIIPKIKEDLPPRDIPVDDFKGTEDINEVCPFGKNKGVLWADMSKEQLNFYKEYFENKIEDKTQMKYRDSNLASYAGVIQAINNMEEIQP